MSNATRTEVKVEAITLDEIYASQYQKANTMTARLRQIINITSFYPSMKPTNSATENVFSDDEFDGTEEQPFVSNEQRIAFINVPDKATAEEVMKRIIALGEKARIYKVLSNHLILTEEQKSAIRNGITTKDIIANSQAIRFGEGSEKEGQLITDTNGKVQYRQTYLSTSGKEDVDLRTSDANDMYLSPELEAELESGEFFTEASEIETVQPVTMDAQEV